MSRNPGVRVYFDRAKLVVDLFAGGGGTSEGIYDALGFAPDIAANHDAEAVAMHQANHPKTKHYIEDVRKLDIPKVCAGRKVGLLWLSPDCKHHSIALVTVAGELYEIADIGMRMLTPRELFRCQGFSDTYIIDVPVLKTRHGKVQELRLSATAQVRMVGNSVPPQFARALVEAQFAAAEERAAA